MTESKLKIAIIGTRGVPANYGGFETFAEEVSKELVSFGHEVFVYGRKRFFQKQNSFEYLGIKTIETPTIFHKYLETPLNAFTAYLDALKRNFDLILVCNAANSPFAWILKLQKAPVIINVDGIERKRSKWNLLGRLWYRLGERASVCFADKIVADADVIYQYYKEKFKVDAEVIRYGVRVEKKQPGEVLEKFNLKQNHYILYVSRIEPENNALGVIQAYNKVDTDLPLVIVGDAPYADQYKKQLQAIANDNVIFTGYQFGNAYKELRSNCLFYIQATEVGGTHPALVEALAYGNCIIANDVPEHREVLEDAGLYYSFNDFDDLATKISNLLNDQGLIQNYQGRAKELAREKYKWSSIAKEYEELFYQLINH